MERNYSIDSLKGVLLLFVIFGHTILGTVDDSFLRYVIYSFHMPLFVFLSGYLLNTTRIQSMSFSGLFIKYWDRMIKQWLLALVVYSCLLSYSQDITLSFIIERICKPFYHLWYIPVLFVMILTTWLIGIIVKDKKQRVFIFVFLGLALCGLYNIKYDLLSYYRLHFFIFFFLGILSKEYRDMYYSQKSTKIIMICGGFLSFVTLLFLIGVTYKDYRIFFMTPFCFALCVWIMLPVILTNSFKSKSLGLIGRHSLEIYLWHVIPILFLKRLINDVILYYSTSFLLIGLVLIVLTLVPSYYTQS